MSVLKEEELSKKLQLFELTLAHAWVSWDQPDAICVKKTMGEVLLNEGTYRLEDFLDEKQLQSVHTYWSQINEEVSKISFSIHLKGVVSNVQCYSFKTDNGIMSLWVCLPEKDNSIFYLQNAAHDFRSPLGSIMGVVNLMQHTIQKEDQLDKEEMSTLLDMIKINADKALNLSGEIMELAEIESQSYELKMKEVKMEDFVKNYLETHRLLTLKKRIKVHFESDTDATVRLNESKLTRALDNVLSNAVKFSKSGSNIYFRVEESDSAVSIHVIDEGIGMSKEILKNVFVKFGSAKRNGLDGEPSHGLGMSIVRQIMKLHAGDVEVTSKEGEGTQVCLIFNK
ncbi:HAMP domain-containing sensor histidine kinase [Ekhidna sp.]|uniref:sensor histidine kinase n=1 Tax=Ekhidna sp. TaxID=2608089 RepID=UPI0032F05199